jgi:leucyl/phenylalanyl-tRNA--protein transferase
MGDRESELPLARYNTIAASVLPINPKSAIRNRMSRFFPPPELAPPEGLLFLGGKLTPDWLLDAYTHGIFPWPVWGGKLAWWSPDPRAILEFERFHVSRRLARTLRSGKFEVTCNRDFAAVIHGCATAQHRRRATWITPPLKAAYQRLHELGHVHSVEVWHEGRLAGGTYGVSIGGLFAAESMFHYITDASKVAVALLMQHLASRGYELVDIQQLTPHTASLGAIEIPRREYLSRLGQACRKQVTFGQSLDLSGFERRISSAD